MSGTAAPRRLAPRSPALLLAASLAAGPAAATVTALQTETDAAKAANIPIAQTIAPRRVDVTNANTSRGSTVTADAVDGGMHIHAFGIPLFTGMVDAAGKRVYYNSPDDASVVMKDNGYFTGTTGAQEGVLVYSVQGSFTSNELPDSSPTIAAPGARVGLGARVDFGGGQHYDSFTGIATDARQLLGYYYACNDTLNTQQIQCRVAPDPGRVVGWTTFPLSSGSPTITISLSVHVEGYTADFSHSAYAYLLLPDGVAYHSFSAVPFLSAAAPISLPVPEPGTGLLGLCGLALLGWRLRRP